MAFAVHCLGPVCTPAAPPTVAATARTGQAFGADRSGGLVTSHGVNPVIAT